MKIRYPAIIRDNACIDHLEVQSFEMTIYLVSLSTNGNQGMLYNADDTLYRFNSTQAIRDAFKGVKVLTAVMLQNSPYDEMIGNPAKAQEPMRLPFSLRQPDSSL